MSAVWGEDHYDLIVMGNGLVEDEVVGGSDKTRRRWSAYVYSLESAPGM
jgi:glucuronate isomerase